MIASSMNNPEFKKNLIIFKIKNSIQIINYHITKVTHVYI